MAMASPFIPQGGDLEEEARARPIAEWLRHVEWSLEKVPATNKDGERYGYTDELATIYKLLAKMRGVLAELPEACGDLTETFARHDTPVLNLLEMTEKPCPPLRVYGYRAASENAEERLAALIAATAVFGIDAVVARLFKMEALLRSEAGAIAAGGGAALTNIRRDLIGVMNAALKRSLAKMKTVNDEKYCDCIHCRIRRNIAGVACSRAIGHELSDDEVSLGTTDPDMPELSSGGWSDDDDDAIAFNGVAMSVKEATAAMDASASTVRSAAIVTVDPGCEDGSECCDGAITVIQPAKEDEKGATATEVETETDHFMMRMLADGHLMTALKRQLKKKDLDDTTKELANKMIIEAKRLTNVLYLGE